MQMYGHLWFDSGSVKSKTHLPSKEFVSSKTVMYICAFLGIIVCSSLTWSVQPTSAAMVRPSDQPTSSTGVPSSTAEASTSIIRQRSLDELHYDDDELDEDSTDESWGEGKGQRISPTFDETTSRNITTQLGQTAYLHCVVNNLGDKTVSWIRRKDFHVLTVGLDIYTSDDRFQARHEHNTNDWTLQIKFAQLRDEGPYECQVSSDPKISFFVNLTVLVAKAVIEGAPDIYVKSGSSINLTCVITQSPIPPVFVFWYHDDRMINYDSSRGGIRVATENGPTTVSRLRVTSARPTDSGNYSCQPSYADPANITVHVLNGEKPAAMQHGRQNSSAIHLWPPGFVAFAVLFTILRPALVLR